MTSIITAAKEVSDRLRALSGFHEMLFSDDWQRCLRERTQLHRLLVHHLWIFGEEYTLDTDDDRLRKVLEKHLRHLGRELLAAEPDPKLINGKDGIPDLMLSRAFRRDRGRIEHLVVELKRPSVTLGDEAITQIKHYALAVANDSRFSKTKVSWRFLLLGNDWDAFAESEASSAKDRPYGCVGDYGSYTVWVQRWSDVLHDAQERYRFFSEKLELEASTDEGIRYLQERYPELMSGKGLTKKQEAELAAEAESSDVAGAPQEA